MPRPGYPRIRFDPRAAFEPRAEIFEGVPTIGARFLAAEPIFCVAQNLVDGHSRVWSSSRLSLYAEIASLQLTYFIQFVAGAGLIARFVFRQSRQS